MADLDYQALFGSDDAAAQASAQALAKALRQRRAAGLLGLATGDPAMGAVGKELTGDADKMEQGLIGAAQHRAGIDVQRKHLENQAQQLQAMMGYRGEQIGLKREQIDAQNELRQRQLDLKSSERIVAHDALGNPIFASKFGGGGGAGRPPARPSQVPGAGSGMPPAQPSPSPMGAGAAPGGAPSVGPLPAGPPPSKGIPDGRGGYILSPGAVDQAAEMYARTGALPPITSGRGGQMIKAAIANRAAELHPESNLAGNKAGYHADTASLSKLQQQADNIEAFERTGRKNLQTMLDMADKIPNWGSQALNKPLRALATTSGDPNMSAFEAARQTAAVESAKILSGALGPLSDSSRHEAELMMDPNATPAQLKAAVGVLTRDFDNRKKANTEQLAEIRGRASGGSGEKKATHRFNPATGKIEAL